MENRVIFFEGPAGIDQWGACGTCGHYSTFDGGFEVGSAGEYVRGWLDDMVSCYDWVSYDPADDDKEDTLDEFRKFLKEHGYGVELAVLRGVFG